MHSMNGIRASASYNAGLHPKDASVRPLVGRSPARQCGPVPPTSGRRLSLHSSAPRAYEDTYQQGGYQQGGYQQGGQQGGYQGQGYDQGSQQLADGDPRQITDSINSCETAVQLAEAIDKYYNEMNYIHVAAVAMKTSKVYFMTRLRGREATQFRDEIHTIVCRDLVPLMLDCMEQFYFRQAANIIWALSKMDLQRIFRKNTQELKEQVIPGLFRVATEQIGNGQHRSIGFANAMYGAGVLSDNFRGNIPVPQELIASLIDKFSEAEDIEPQHLANFMYGLGFLSQTYQPDESFLILCENRLLSMEDQHRCQNLANYFGSAAKFSHIYTASPEVISMIDRIVQANEHDLRTTHSMNFVQGMALFLAPGSAGAESLAAPAGSLLAFLERNHIETMKMERFPGRSTTLTAILLAFSELKHLHQVSDETVQLTQDCAMRMIFNFFPPEIEMLKKALDNLGVDMTPELSEEIVKREEELAERQAARERARAERFAGQEAQ